MFYKHDLDWVANGKPEKFKDLQQQKLILIICSLGPIFPRLPTADSAMVSEWEPCDQSDYRARGRWALYSDSG